MYIFISKGLPTKKNINNVNILKEFSLIKIPFCMTIKYARQTHHFIVFVFSVFIITFIQISF